jgi:hypothetical protein
MLCPYGRQSLSGRNDSEGKNKGGEPGRLAPLVSPFGESPASLTEGGWPVVCWPAYETPQTRKKFHGK